MTNPGFHHLHTRKRTSPYPHPDPKVRLVDDVAYVVALLGPMTALPQLIAVWRGATDIALTSWVGFLVIACVWLLYGIVHKEWPIIISNTLWVVIDLLIVVLAL